MIAYNDKKVVGVFVRFSCASIGGTIMLNLNTTLEANFIRYYE
jgi:hypothetical protein